MVFRMNFSLVERPQAGRRPDPGGDGLWREPRLGFRQDVGEDLSFLRGVVLGTGISGVNDWI